MADRRRPFQSVSKIHPGANKCFPAECKIPLHGVKSMPFPILLVLVFALPQSVSSASTTDALSLLNEVSQRYADARSYHIEAVEEQTSSNELSRHWDKTLLTAIVMADGRYRYCARGGFGSAILVSDGKMQWNYHPYDHAYTQQPASSDDPLLGRVIGPQEMPLMTAKSIITQLAHRADRVKSATFLPDESISVDGKSTDCYVIHYFDEPSPRSAIEYEWTVWIDKSRKLVLKTVRRGDTLAPTTAGGRIPRSTETTVTYTVVELDQREPASSFAFVAPADAKLVTDFPNVYAQNSASVEPADLTGKAEPAIQLKSSDGKIIMLSGFRGKPVFVEFWATWCTPCVDLMPGLEKLYAETADKGLVWMSVDSDRDTSAAASYLAREHIAWTNYHDEDGSLGKAFHRIGIPLGVLIDANGQITFYKSGYGIAELRAAVAKLGPEFHSVAVASIGTTAPNSK